MMNLKKHFLLSFRFVPYSNFTKQTRDDLRVAFESMTKGWTLILMVFLSGWVYTAKGQYSSCAAAAGGTPLTDGDCLVNQSFPGSQNMAGLCVGGSNPSIYIPFVAGSCSEFTFNPDATAGSNVGFRILTVGCANVTGSVSCSGGATSGVDMTWSQINSAGTNLNLTAGTTYVLHIWGDVGGTWDICYSANVPEALNNECSGATSLSPSGATFYNGGFCAYSGSYNDATTSDLAASEYCAGSLENTQWVTFSPVAGASSFQIIGTGIACADGACAFQFGIFSGSCGSLTPEGCVSNGNPCAAGPDPNSAINENAGDGYSISWSGTSATGFTATITTSSGATFDGTETFYLAMDGNSGSDCTYNLTGVNIQILPMELMFFKGIAYNEVNKLSWMVASQTNNDFFAVEKSLDGMSWTLLEIVKGAGTIADAMQYSVIDENPSDATTFYRLVQQDLDGKFSTSRALAVIRSTEKAKVIRRLNLMGQEVDDLYKGIVVLVYENGETKKIFHE